MHKHSCAGDSSGNQACTPPKQMLYFDALLKDEPSKHLHKIATPQCKPKKKDWGKNLIHLHPAQRRIVGKKKQRKANIPQDIGTPASVSNCDETTSFDDDDAEFFRKVKMINDLREKGIFIRSSEVFNENFKLELVIPETPSVELYPIHPSCVEDIQFIESRTRQLMNYHSMVDDNDDGPDYGDDFGPLAMQSNSLPTLDSQSQEQYCEQSLEKVENERKVQDLQSDTASEHLHSTIEEDNKGEEFPLGFFFQAVKDRLHNAATAQEMQSLNVRSKVSKFRTASIPSIVNEYCDRRKEDPIDSIVDDYSVLDTMVKIPTLKRTIRLSPRQIREWAPTNSRGLLVYTPRGMIPTNFERLNFFSMDQFINNGPSLLASLLKRGVNIITHNIRDCDENTVMLIPPENVFVANEFVHTFVPLHTLNQRYAILRNFKAIKFKIENLKDVIEFFRRRLAIQRRTK